MELSALEHIEPEKLGDFQADLFVAAMGFESRNTYVSRRLPDLKCEKVLLVPKPGVRAHQYEQNLAYYRQQDFELLELPARIPDLNSLFSQLKGPRLRLLMDCTSMPPLWYYEFFKWLGELQGGFQQVHLRVAYTMAAFMEIKTPPRVKGLWDFLGDQTKSSSRKKRALMLGTGEEQGVSEAIYDLVKPDLLYLFYADPPVDKRYVEQVFVHNHDLISRIPIRNLVAFPIKNAQAIYQRLVNTVLPLRQEYQVLLVPHGPKIFSLSAMLVHMGYPDISISYPSFNRSQVLDYQPHGDPVVLDALFEAED